MRPIVRRVFPALLGCVLAGSAQAQSSPVPSPSAAPRMFEAPEYVMGNPNAGVTVVEYASASCPHCARFDINVVPAFKAKYIDTGQVRYVFREFLTPPAELAAAGFLLARCAGREKYWTVVEDVFHAQAEVYAKSDIKGPFDRIAHSVGLTDPQVEACLNSKPALDALNKRVDEAVNRAKIDGTPTFLVNGVKVFSGEVDLAKLSTAIDPLVMKRNARRPGA